MEHHVHDVGKILLGAQAELRNIRDAIRTTPAGLAGELGSAAMKSDSMIKIDHVISKAENHLKAKAEAMLSLSLDQSPSTLPLIQKGQPNTNLGISEAPVPTLHQRQNSSLNQISASNTSNTQKKKHTKLSIKTCHRSIAASRTNRVKEGIRRAQEVSMMRNPTKPGARQYLAQRYGLNLEESASARKVPNCPSKGKVLNPTHRVTSNTSGDLANEGMLTLMNKGIVSSYIDATEAFVSGSDPVLRQEPVKLQESKAIKNNSKIPCEAGSTPLTVKLDTTDYKATYYPDRRNKVEIESKGKPKRRDISSNTLEIHGETHTGSSNSQKIPSNNHSDEGEKETQDLHSAVNTIRGYNELLDTYSLHRFIIRNGQTLLDTPEFQSFKRKYVHIWGTLRQYIQQLENIFTQYAIPVAFVDGQKLVNLAMDEISQHTELDFVNCLANAAEVELELNSFGRKYILGKREQLDSAASVIQAASRRYLVRCRFLHDLTRSRSALEIQHMWRGHRDFTRAQREIGKRRSRREKKFKDLQQWLCGSWPTIKETRRVVVHIPSISLEEHVRLDIEHLAQHENAQMARLCEVADPQVDVIYVCPFLLTDDVVSYYQKVLAIGGVEEPKRRFKIVVPENVSRFPEHFSLSTVLLYSPRALRRIKRIIQDQTAYIVPGVVGADDQNLAVELNIPLLGPSPKVSSFYTSVSGAKTIFREAGVNAPPMLREVYEESELKVGLSKLIVGHLHVNRWVLRIDDDFGCRGAAYLDVDTMFCVNEMRKEKAKISSTNAGYWNRPDVQATSQSRVLEGLERELLRRLRLCFPGLYSRGTAEFLEVFCRVGGVVEADARGMRQDKNGNGHADLMSPSVNLFIEPSDTVCVTSAHDRITSTDNVVAGSSFPQRSVPQRAITGAAQAIGTVLRRHKVFGHVQVDFEAYYESNGLKMWATGIHLGLSNSAVSFALFQFLTDGYFDLEKGSYTVEEDDPEFALRPARMERTELRGTIKAEIAAIENGSEAPRGNALGTNPEHRETVKKPRERCFVCFESLFHSNLSTLRYGSFFNACRRRDIAFDLQNRTGLAFILVDGLASGAIGALAVGYTFHHALETMAAALGYIREEVGLYSNSTGGASKPRISGEDPDGNNFAEIYNRVRLMKQVETNRVQKHLKQQRKMKKKKMSP